MLFFDHGEEREDGNLESSVLGAVAPATATMAPSRYSPASTTTTPASPSARSITRRRDHRSGAPVSSSSRRPVAPPPRRGVAATGRRRVVHTPPAKPPEGDTRPPPPPTGPSPESTATRRHVCPVGQAWDPIERMCRATVTDTRSSLTTQTQQPAQSAYSEQLTPKPVTPPDAIPDERKLIMTAPGPGKRSEINTPTIPTAQLPAGTSRKVSPLYAPIHHQGPSAAESAAMKTYVSHTGVEAEVGVLDKKIAGIKVKHALIGGVVLSVLGGGTWLALRR